MTQEDKELLIKDLCARLPYKVICRKDAKTVDGESFYLDEYPSALELTKYLNCDIEVNIKPYLRSMSSMTEKEKWDFGRIFNSFSYLKLELLENGLSFHEIYDITGMCDITWNELNTAIDWLNAHHFDYRGLIPMGLALEAPNEIYNN